MTNELATVKNFVPAHIADFEEDAGKGLAAGGADDFMVPFLQIIQTNSPQLNKRDGRYVEGLSSGDIFNSVTFEFGESFSVVPVFYERFFIEWEPRATSSKSPVGRYLADSDVVSQALLRPRGPKNEVYSGKGQNTLVDTRYHYVLVVKEDGTFYPALIGLASTGVTISRRWNSLMKSVVSSTGKTLPSFCRKYKYRSVPKSNDQGTWNAADFSFGDFLLGKNDPIYVAAKDFFEKASKGGIKVDDASMSSENPNGNPDLSDVEEDESII